jgi:hypothetical protein
MLNLLCLGCLPRWKTEFFSILLYGWSEECLRLVGKRQGGGEELVKAG